MKKRMISLILTFSILLSALPLSALTAFAQDNVLYGDADGNGKVELLDVNLMERYIEGDEAAKASIHFTEADVNADGVVDDTDVQMVKDYLVGNLDSLTPTLHTISFVTNGGGEIEPIQAGEGCPYKGEIPTPAKDNYIFVHWEMENGEVYYPLTEIISTDLVLTAVYEPVEPKEELNVTSFSLDNQKPDVSFEITGSFTDANEVKANITVLPKDGSDPVAVDVKANGGDSFTVYAPEGFRPGSSYELTLGEGLCFVNEDGVMDEMFRTVYFIIEKDQVNNLKYDPDMIFIQDTAEMKYTIGSQTVDVLESALLSTDESTEEITGSFTMTAQKLQKDDIVCIYETTDPRTRDYTENNYEGDAMAFIRITAVNGNTYTFESLDEEDSNQVLAMPDSFPFKVDNLPISDGTVDINSYDAYALSMLGQTEAPEFKVDDFLTFYTADFTELTDDSPVVYGQITKVEGNTISYKIIDKQYIEDFMSMFVSQDVDSSEILENLNQEEFLSQVEQQALESGFAEEAAMQMAQNAFKTDELQQKLLNAGFTVAEIQELNASPMAAPGAGGGRVMFSVSQPVVKASALVGEHFENGVGIALNVGVVLSIDKKTSSGKTISLKIDLSAGFEQEVALGFDIDIEDRWKWYFIIPVLQDVDVTASIDVQNYTYMTVGAKIYTVSEENIKKWKNLSSTTEDPGVQDLIRKINKLGAKVKKLEAKGEEIQAILDEIEGYKQQLPTVKVDGVEYSIEQLEEALGAEDVSTAFDEVFSAKNEAESKTGMEQLMNRYKEMLEQECDWIELINQPLINQTYWIAIAAVKVNLNFVVSANINIQLGADMEYQVGKRYSFWIHILDGTSGSSEMDLIDERFAFQFYVMGTLGVKAGIKAEIAFGLLSTDLASIGANVEFGAYVKLYGYFIYYFEDLRPANTNISQETEEMMGALYVDFGLYVTVKFKTQVFFNAFKYEPTLYDNEFPLLTAGVRQNAYDFVLDPDEDDVMYVWDDDANSVNGISMALPETFRTMKTIDLVTGDKSQTAYEANKFIVTFDDEKFSFKNGNVIVDVPEGSRYLTCNMRIVWKADKLTFSKYDIDITVPVVWTNMSQSELNEKFTVNVAVGNKTDGYTTVWSERHGRLDVFDLPSEEEILDLIDYDSYTTENGTNLKYASIEGYQDESTGISLTTDKTFFFNVTSQTYTLTITDVEKADGSTEKRTYTAKYGETFDLSDLQSTGTVNDKTRTYTRFFNLTNPNEPDEEKAVVDKNNLTMDLAFIQKYGTAPTLQANYLNTTLTATYQFIGLGNNVPPVTVNFQSGTTPYYEDLQNYIKEQGGAGAIIISVSPEIGPSEKSITYTIVCQIDETERPSYTLSFDTQDGSPMTVHTYPQGSLIFPIKEPTRTGYTFAGWYQEKECMTPFDFTMHMPNKNITAYAKWTANTYTLNFSTTTGSAPASRPIVYGEKYGELPVLSDNVMRFLGWYTAASGGTEVTADTVFTGTSNQTLYAHWETKSEIQESWITVTPRTENYDETEPGFPVSFSVNSPNGDLSAEDFTVSYLWEKAGSEWTTNPPVNAGGYLVKISRKTDNTYQAFEMTTDTPSVVINKIDMSGTAKLSAPKTTISNWIATVDISSCGVKGDGKITYIMKRNYTTSDGYPTSSVVDKNTTGTFDISSYNYGSGTYAFGIEVAAGTNYNSAASWFKTYTVNSSGNTGKTFARSSSSLAKDTELLAMTKTVAEPTAITAAPVTLSAKAAPMQMTLTEDVQENPTMTLSPEEIVLNRGKEFEVKLDLDQAVNVWGILAAIDYDVDTLELLGYTYGDIFTESQFTTQNDLTAAPYKLLATLDEISTVSADGNFITLKFKVKENAAEKETTISLKDLQVVDEEAAVAVNIGSDICMAVDETAPIISGIKDGETYYGNTIVTIEEDHLASVTVNGEIVTVTDGTFTLKPAEGKQTVIATDKAGNSTTVTITVNEVSVPHTGENNTLILWMTLLFASGSALGLLIIKRTRKKQR